MTIRRDNTPPRWANRLLEWYCSERFLEEIQGDLHEHYERTCQASGPGKASRQFVIQVFRFMRPFRIKRLDEWLTPQFYPDMIAHYFTTAIRNLLRFRTFSFLTILGLTIGMAACILILRYVSIEWSYDKFHHQSADIYRIQEVEIIDEEDPEEVDIYTGSAIAPLLQDQLPELLSTTRVHPWYEDMVLTTHTGTAKQEAYFEKEGFFVDPAFFKVFTFPFVAGDPASVFEDPTNMVITRSAAIKFFGSSEAAMGQSIQVDGGWANAPFVVTGVLEDPPVNSHLSFRVLLSIDHILDHRQYAEDNGWGWENFYSYARLDSDVSPEVLSEKATPIAWENKPEEPNETEENYQVLFYPVENIHLYSQARGEMQPSGNHESVRFFAIIAMLVLLIAWINYLNLSTSRALSRAVEVGIRKTIGAYRSQVAWQFLLEAVFLNILSLGLAVCLAIYLQPVLSDLIGKDLSEAHTDDTWMWVGFGITILAGALLSGLYPAMVLSAFKPVDVLKGLKNKQIGGISLRKALVVLQFSVSVALIAGTLAVYQQVSFMQTDDPGMNLEEILVVDGPQILPEDLDWEARLKKIQTFKSSLATVPGVMKVSTGGAIPGGGFNWGTGIRGIDQPAESTHRVQIIFVDAQFADTYGMELLAGRSFDDELIDDQAAWVNESLLASCGLGEPHEAVGKNIVVSGDTVPVTGVLKDYSWDSNRRKITPMILVAPAPWETTNLCIKLSTADLANTLTAVEETYLESFPGNPFRYKFQDEFFNQQYQEDQQFGNIFGLFTLLAMIVACLGLFGLASFAASQRIKEIGIRKVVGASVMNLLLLLSRDFLMMIALSILVGLGTAWWLTSKWLEEFPRQITLGIWFFLIPAAIVLVIALLTISWKTFRTAGTNPVEALRYE